MGEINRQLEDKGIILMQGGINIADSNTIRGRLIWVR